MKTFLYAIVISMFLSMVAIAEQPAEVVSEVVSDIEMADTTLTTDGEIEFVPVTDNYVVLDTDGSGTLSSEEAEVIPALTEQWESLDTDQSGELDSEEFAAFEWVETEDQEPLEAIVEEVLEETTAE